MSTLKPGWRRVHLGDVVDVVTDYWDRAPSHVERYVAGEHIDEGSLRVARWGLTSDDLVPPTFNRKFRAGDVLFHSRNLRKLARPDFDGITGEKLFVLRTKNPRDLLPNLLPFLLQTDLFNEYVNRMWAGSTNKFLNKAPLIKYEFALPPLEEQRRISDLCAALRDVVELASDAEMRAHESFRALRNERFKEFYTGGYSRRTLDELALRTGIVDGPFGSNLKTEHWTSTGVPVVQSQHITSGRYRMTDPFFVSDETFSKLHRSEAKGGDIVMVKKGVNCGACALLDSDHPSSLLSSNCMRIRIQSPEACTAYVAQFLHWYRERGRFEGLIGSTQQRATTLREVRRVEVPVPPNDVQLIFVEHLQSLQRATQLLRTQRTTAQHLMRLGSFALAGGIR
jgi:type I restriction enzyme S subunit